MSTRVPRVLLIGAGRFGKHHLRVLRTLATQNIIDLVGVVVRSNKSAKHIHKETGLPTYTRLTTALLNTVDAVDIVTPYTTHAALIKRCLPYADVFVEKPLAAHSKTARALTTLARAHKRTLMVGHIYRYHPVIKELERHIQKRKKELTHIECTLLTPRSQWRGESAPLEKLHWFDFLDLVFGGARPRALWAKGDTSACTVSLRYNNTDVTVNLGWPHTQTEKARSITLQFKKETVRADFVTQTITTTRNGKESIRPFPAGEPLEHELRDFIQHVRGSTHPYPDGTVGTRIVEMAEQVERALKAPHTRIAVIGGGLFGATAALELAHIGTVTLFESKNTIMDGATRANQYRHHVGYHYPRSIETIQEIRAATKDFESRYKKAIVHHPAYYAIAKKGSLVNAKKFLAVCKHTHIPHPRATLPSHILNPREVALTIKTSEAVINHSYLQKEIIKQLRTKHVTVRYNSTVIGARLTKTGSKILTIQTSRGVQHKEFDYVVNATYHRHNDFCSWLNFPTRDLELRLKELPIVRLPLQKPIAVTLMDGPFATFVPIGNTGLYTFGDVPLSVHATATGSRAAHVLEQKKRTVKSRWTAMQKRCQQWFPLIKDATYVESMFVILPVEKRAKDTDARPTEVTNHGFGCFSVLSGKLITTVSAAKNIAAQIQS